MTDLSHITPSLHALAVPVDTLTEDVANVRVHDVRNLDAIKASLAQFGQRSPIIVQVRPDGSRIIRAGNGRLLAARELVHEGDERWRHVAAVLIEESDTAATAYAIADNRTAELARWDDVALVQTLEALQQEDAELFGATGFDDVELEILLEGLEADPLAESFDPGEQDERERVRARIIVTCEFDEEELVRGLISQLVQANELDGVVVK